MSIEISPDNETFIDQQVAEGQFPSRQAALDAAVELLRRRTSVLNRIDTGRRQLDDGDFIEYDDESLRQRFDQLKSKAQGAGTE